MVQRPRPYRHDRSTEHPRWRLALALHASAAPLERGAVPRTQRRGRLGEACGDQLRAASPLALRARFIATRLRPLSANTAETPAALESAAG